MYKERRSKLSFVGQTPKENLEEEPPNNVVRQGVLKRRK